MNVEGITMPNRLLQHVTSQVVSIMFLLFCFGASTAWAQCPTPEWACSYWPTIVYGVEGEATGHCEGPACFDKSYGDEVTVVAADDSLFPDKFTLRHSGDVINLSCVDVETKLQKKATKTTVWMPEQRHCSVEQHTVDHLYLHLFTSGMENLPECVAWLQCKIY